MVIAEWLVDLPISKRSAMINRSVVGGHASASDDFTAIDDDGNDDFLT